MNKLAITKKPIDLKKAVSVLRKRSVSYISKNFEDTRNLYDYLDYHNNSHIISMIRRLDTLINLINTVKSQTVSSRDRQLAYLAVAYHDIVQNWRAVSSVDGGMVIKERRKSKRNEYQSALWALREMDNLNNDYGYEIFTFQDKKLVRQMILGTCVRLDTSRRTLYQPLISKFSGEMKPVVTVFALADLDRVVDGPSAYIVESRKVFREENLDIKEKILKKLDSLDYAAQQELRQRLTLWPQKQANFVKGRKYYIEEELKIFSPLLRKKLSSLYRKTTESVIRQEVYKLKTYKESKTIEAILRDFGYVI